MPSHAVRYRTIQTVNVRGFRKSWTSCPLNAYWTGTVSMEISSYNMLFSDVLNLSFSPLCLTFSESYQNKSSTGPANSNQILVMQCNCSAKYFPHENEIYRILLICNHAPSYYSCNKITLSSTVEGTAGVSRPIKKKLNVGRPWPSYNMHTTLHTSNKQS